MNKKTQLFYYLFVIALPLLFSSSQVKGQTEGTLTFTFTETVSSASKNVMAVWIEDNSGVFVKTKMRFWGSGTNDHLPTWVNKSNKDVVDAITGATLTASTNPTAFGVKTVTWDGKDISNATVADGTYKIFVETSWNNPEPSKNQHSSIIDFSFDKSSVEAHITPTGNSNFSGITIDWIPTITSIDSDNSDKLVSIYPNPSKGKVNIQFMNSEFVSRILVENIKGEVVYEENVNKSISASKSIDLQHLNAGIYLIEVLFTESSKNYRTKIVINK